MAFYDDGKQTIHYLERGQGEALLLIHGLGCSGADWALQIAALEKKYRVIVPDLPGCGQSPAPCDGYGIASQAGTLWRLLEHLGVASVNLVGFSLGGAVALEMAAAHPDLVPRLALINSLATYRPHTLRKWLETYLAACLVQLLGTPRAASLMARRLFPKGGQRALREHAVKVLSAVPSSNYLSMGFALARWAILDRLHLVRSKVLLVAAEHDFTPLDEKVELAYRLHGSIVVVRGSRHGTPFDSSQITNACLKAFLRDAPLPKQSLWLCDSEAQAKALTLTGSIPDEHASKPLLTE